MRTKISAINKTTAPAANAVLASLAGLTQDQTYDITVNITLFGAAPAAADAGNIQLRVGGVAQFAIPVAPVQNALQQFSYKIGIPHGGGTVDLQAIGAGTASLVYMTQLEADSGSMGG